MPTPTIRIRGAVDGIRIDNGAKPKADIKFIASGSANPADIETAMLETAYSTYGVLLVTGSVVFLPLKSMTIELTKSPLLWYVTVHYEIDVTNPQTNEVEDTFELGGANSEKVFVARYGQVGSYGTVPSGLDNSLGVSANGEVAGLEVPPPDSIFTKTAYLPNATVTPSFLQSLSAMVNTVNNGTFFGRPPGQVRIMGISGHQRGWGTDYQLGFRFGEKQNITSGAGIMYGTYGPIVAAGWDFIDVHTIMTLVGSGSSARMKPQVDFVRIMRWALWTDFSTLGIGT